MAPVVPCERAPNDIRKVLAKSETDPRRLQKRCFGCEVESPESRRQRGESSHPKKIMKITLQLKDVRRCLITISSQETVTDT